MEVEEVQVKMEDGAKTNGNTSEKVLVDKEVLKNLINVLKNPVEGSLCYNKFYIVNSNHKVECFQAIGQRGNYVGWGSIKNKEDFEFAKNQNYLCSELSNLSFEEIKKLGETQEPGVYFKGKKVWDL